MAWFYRQADVVHGPIEGSELSRLVNAGELPRDVEVRRDDETNFRPFADYFAAVHRVAQVAASPAPDRIGWIGCTLCDKSFPPDQLLHHGSERLCAACKAVYFQRLREGLPPSPRHPDGAPLVRRLQAKLWDRVLQGFFCGALARKMIFFSSGTTVARASAVLTPVILVLAYDIFKTVRSGQTLGKRVMSLRVIGPDGRPPNAGRAIARSLYGLLDLLPLGAGYWMSLTDRDRRSLGDRLSGTRVVVDE